MSSKGSLLMGEADMERHAGWKQEEEPRNQYLFLEGIWKES